MNDMMETNIKKQLGIVEKAIDWINPSPEDNKAKDNSLLKGNKAKETYRCMVNCRRQLNRKKFSLEGNPAAAMYGESQAGKSYLVSALLSGEERSFVIADGHGNEYDFKNHINPRGNEMESTSLVTRFSTKFKYEKDDYPIIAKMLTPTDLILVICEAYYHNLNVNKTLSYNDINKKIKELEDKYSTKSECQKLIIEDDVIDIEEYFNENFTKLVFNNLKDARFFEKLSTFVTKIPFEEWKDVFPLFWNFNPQLTKLFHDLIGKYSQLNFADTTYLPIDAVLREKGTILDVSRLDEIYDVFKGQELQYSETSKIFFRDSTGKNHTSEFSKPYLCALAAELIFVLPESIVEQKPFLAQTDLLDFPGTRRFETTSEDNITDKSLTVLLRRGKVDYLFNKYSNSERINVLLFCQNHKQSNQSVMPEKLNRWISSMIGKTPAERETYKSPISPLFIISTWFNKDLEFDFSSDKPDNIQSLNERWNQRFTKTLEKEIVKSYEYPWLVEWTITNPFFQNIFLLRDFEKSGTDTQNCSNIFEGYHEFKKEVNEIVPTTYPGFREELKNSFINYEFVQRHFANPAESWEEAATINRDGTKLIIDKLTVAAASINPARINKIRSELNTISQTILTELRKYFHSTDKDEELQKAKDMAGDIQFMLDSYFSADRIKDYGKLMKEMMLDESSVLEHFRKQVHALEHRDVVNKDKYSNYRMAVPVEENDTAEKYFERLCIRYERTSDERKRVFRAELEAKKIDLDELIQGNFDLIKNNAQQLSEALLEFWFEYVSLNDKHYINEILGRDASLDHIKEMYRKLFKKLGISKRIAEKIRRYVDGHSKVDLPYEIVADISTEMFNKCIHTVGLDYLDESEINGLREANTKNKLGLVLDICTNPTENSVEELFTRIENWTEIIQSRPQEMKSLPSYRNYQAWSHRLKIGFVLVCDIPNYDVTANANLGKIIGECLTIEY